MAFIAPLLPFIAGGAAAAGATALLRPSTPKVAEAAAAPLAPTRNDALARADAADNLARRTGARKLRRTPAGGAEALTGPKTSLLGRSG